MSTKRRGFSLVELLVVIGIIGILLAIIVPVYGRAKEKGRQAKCAANFHAIVAAIRMYRDDWGAYPHVIARDPATSDYTSKDDEGSVVALYTTGDLDDRKGLICSDDKGYDPTKPNYTSFNSWDNPENDPAQADQLYNWYGYAATQYGRALETMQQAEDTYAPGGTALRDARNRPLWIPDPNGTPGTWTGAFPGLANRNAPDRTVITHCPHHRASYSPPTYSDLVAFLGGHVELKRIAPYDWVRQEE